MKDSKEPQLTDLLNRWGAGDRNALDRLIPLVYEDLRRAATVRMAHERRGHSWQPTDLVNQVLLGLCANDRELEWQSKKHFYAFFGKLMRLALIDNARARNSKKRDHAAGLPDWLTPHTFDRPERLLLLDDVLKTIESVDPQLVSILELRFFAGFSEEETAQILGISRSTVQRNWKIAKKVVALRVGETADGSEALA